MYLIFGFNFGDDRCGAVVKGPRDSIPHGKSIFAVIANGVELYPRIDKIYRQVKLSIKIKIRSLNRDFSL